MKNSTIGISLAVSVILCNNIALSVTLHVPTQYPTIQEAINAAQDSDTVLVAPQTYAGPNNRALDFLGKSIVVRSESGAAQTIIDCQEQDRGVNFHNAEDSSSIFEGFTIQNGYVSGEVAGGGIICMGSSPTIRDNIITNCEAY